MISNNMKGEDLKEVFDDLEEGFQHTGIDFYLIGALARDTWYQKAAKDLRTTQDADFAIFVSTAEEYEQIKNYLIAEKGFTPFKGNAYILFAPNKVQVDILPFGSIEIDGTVAMAGGGLTQISVNGFMEVYSKGTEKTEISTGHHFKVATLPAIVMLKLIAFDDRPEQRIKDAGDVGNILRHFFDLQTDLIYSDAYNDLFTTEIDTIEEISAIVIGREIKKIVQTNPSLHQRLKTILQTHIRLQEESMFVRQMGDRTIEASVTHLSALLTGLE